ncbi:MAG TPA: aspartate-semialdehyde dehydrogenase [Anaerolineae bacterium]|nr:aspartate-semialdehyde dehydrogenase [Caldilineae bacterium]HID33702.1 aspartate-semialdehyde dehydrogenase [Anaerolineae bacterium]
MSKIPVGVIGATGAVGQRFISLLAHHPWFEITDLLASERSAGRRYGDVVNWILSDPLPARIANLTVQRADAGAARARVLFSALPASEARTLEPLFASRGHYIFSNASAFRMAEDVPLVITEVNPDHLDMIPLQQARRGWEGFIVCNANCTATHLVGALHPLHQAFGVKKAFVATLQAASGAGYPGIPSMDLIDNIVPHSYGEEEKVETEPRKIMGTFANGQFQFAEMTLTAHCHRVPVLDGHTEAVSVALARETTREAIIDAFRSYRGLPQELGLPSAPDPVVALVEGMHRPQPRLDRMAGGGMATVVGRIRPCNLLDWRFSLLGHNTIRGAAGGSILNAELMAHWGRLSP